jgi:predicted phosphohydrolase
MRVVCLSDTHNRQGRFTVPDGDILVHAGDFSMMGRHDELVRVATWLAALPHRHKIVVAGNHDWMFQLDPPRARSLLAGVTYLEDSAATVEGLRVWGSPWQPEFGDWAFNLPRGHPLAQKWALIPAGVDILVTHGPPLGIGDVTCSGDAVGCGDLKRELNRVRPRLHVFGHIHEGCGVTRADGTIYVNASVCDKDYRPVNPPVVVDL